MVSCVLAVRVKASTSQSRSVRRTRTSELPVLNFLHSLVSGATYACLALQQEEIAVPSCRFYKRDLTSRSLRYNNSITRSINELVNERIEAEKENRRCTVALASIWTLLETFYKYIKHVIGNILKSHERRGRIRFSRLYWLKLGRICKCI